MSTHPLTSQEADVLLHTSRTGRYVTGEAEVIAMAARGLLRDYGPQALAGGDHYFEMTPKGREALKEWKAAQPAPPKPKRSKRSPAFAAWRAMSEHTSISFRDFLQRIWPKRHRDPFLSKL